MKAKLFALFVGLLMLGCGDETIDLDDKETLDKIIAEAIDGNKLKPRSREDRRYHDPKRRTPYTGWVKRMWKNGQVRELFQLKDGEGYRDGKENGLLIAWYETGKKWKEKNYKDGKMDGPSNFWYPNGQKRSESTYKDGKLITAVGWKPNGEKCPVTNVVAGNGVCARYNEDGTELERFTFKDGEEVKD
jgi:antitoxin component YwqK of YwqJK toxin-antitoxin module